tara:strand:- start:1862 stop:3520 length:1659 start_codon:yes stop_codon:yes gene_type:complete
MKYIVTESQYKILLTEDRVDYLKTQHVMTKRQVDDLTKGEKESEVEREPGGLPPKKSVKVVPIQDESGVDIAYLYTSKKGKTSVKLSEEIFNDITEADPTRNKAYVSWMISVFLRHISEEDIDQAVRFLTEDLPEATEFLEVFDRVKKKKVFKTGAPNRPNAPSDVSDISQYNDLAHLYSIVSPFVGEDDGDDEDMTPGKKLWNKLKKYIDLGHARLAYRDNDVLVYIPDTIEASCDPLGNLASWCTRREGNSYFDSYRNNNRKPNGDPSDLYVVIPKTMFEGDPTGDDFYPLQLHFETGQLHNKNNSNIGDEGLRKLINKFPGFKTYFTQELGALAADDVKEGDGLMKSRYIEYLNKFGGSAKDVISDDVYQQGVKNIRKLASEQQVPLQQNKYLKWLMENTDGVQITDYLDTTTETLDFSNMNLGAMPDLSKFTQLRRLTLNNCGVNELPPVKFIPTPNKISVFSFANNNIKKAPLPGYSEVLPSCFLFNLDDNPLSYIDVTELEKMVNVSGLSRFTYDDSIVNNLSPENKIEFEKFLSDDDEIGYFTGS